MTSYLLLVLLWAARFVDVTDVVGLDFVHDAGEEGRYLLPEITGSGAAFLDYDDDGDLDLYLVQSGRGKPNRLFRQGSDGRFEDVTDHANVGDPGYGMGVAVGDIDNDGLVDLYVTNYGRDVLYKNEGGNRFRDVTEEWGISGEAWSASATFCDFDADGFLDLYVTRYVDYDPDKPCTQADGSVDYCSPQVFSGTPDVLYRNDRARGFVDVSARAGLRAVRAPGLGVLCADLDDDGRLDFYVANDGEANQLWRNQGSGVFTEEAFLLGVALNYAGQPEAGMGVAAGDADGDGDLDLFLTHIVNQTNTLYLNAGAIGYEDLSTSSGLGVSSLAVTGFGTGFVDFDHDGDLDIAVVNGRVQRRPPLAAAKMSTYWNAYAEPNQLLENRGQADYIDVSAETADFGVPTEVSRGLAMGDVDADGDLDFVVMNTATRARLYRNETDKKGDWLIVRALEANSKRDAHGVRVTLSAGGKRYVRLASPGYGYLSSSDPRAHFGIPREAAVESVEVVWSDGISERFASVATNRVAVVEKGKGRR